ncbi:hypothetical protein [Collimonas sp. OK242]|uniref:hypothetical protein n=1 Tax=Collimonas sp. OK242 TaxID=1798195 RepID=UPI00115FFFAA|nr:hypothetical protein [Collimonas sp. OK242]
MKKLVLATVLSAMVVAPAMAIESKISADDTQQIFHTGRHPLELSDLSQQEMKETEGAFLPPPVVGAIGGAIGGAAIYAGSNYLASKPVTWMGAGIAAGAGALVGSGGGALIVASGGGVAGNLAWRPAMIAANYSLQQIGNGTIGKPGLACTGNPCILPK